MVIRAELEVAIMRGGPSFRRSSERSTTAGAAGRQLGRAQ